jgi:hypothetical protein
MNRMREILYSPYIPVCEKAGEDYRIPSDSSASVAE